MEGKVNISPRQVFFLLSMCRISIVLLWFHVSNQDIWITEILSLLYVPILCFPILFFSQQFKNLSLVEYLQVVMGQVFGKIIGLLYAAFFFALAVIDLSLFDNIIKPINFPETPDVVIVLIAVICCAYGVYKGLECIARTAEILVPVVLMVILFYALLQIPDMDFRALLPILSDSTFWQINTEAFSTAARLNEIVVLAMLAPYISQKNKTNSVFFWSVMVITVYSLIIIVPTIAGLSIGVAKKTFDPYYLFIKQINIYDFITRIEFLIVAAWNIGMFLKISLMLYLGTMSVVQVMKVKKRKFLIAAMIVVVFLITLKSNILKSAVVFTMIEKYIPYINLLFIFAIPLIVLMIFFLRKMYKTKPGCNV
jgi:spore germination protein (amino acid permease)